MNLRDFRLRIRSLLFGRRAEDELQEELDFHLDMQARKNRSQGVSDEAARHQARLKFGNVATVADECRDQRGIQFVDSLGRDIRYAGRQLRRTPIFTAVALLSLPLGIGANTALFTVFDTLYLRKLLVPQPDDFVSFRWRARGESNPLVPGGVFGSLITSSDSSGSGYQASTSFPLRTFEAFRKSRGTPAEVFGFARFAASADIRGWPRDVTAQLELVYKRQRESGTRRCASVVRSAPVFRNDGNLVGCRQGLRQCGPDRRNGCCHRRP